MPSTHSVRLLILLSIAFALTSGCAFQDQHAILKYKQIADVTGGGGTVVVAKPTGPELKLQDGKQVIGTVKNTLGMVTADVTSEHPVQEWVMTAMTTELTAAGYQVQPTEVLPGNCSRGVEVRLTKVWVDQDPGFWTVGAVANVQFRMALYANGNKVKEVDVEGTGQGSRSTIGHTGTKESAMMTALQQAMKQAMPHVVAAFPGTTP